jgi:hypothetical protein
MLIAPFVAFSVDQVAVGMVAVTTALFVYGAARSGQPLRLWALASWPFWYNVILAQWGILFLAMLLLPGLVWLAPVKPQLGLSVFMSRFQWRQALWAGMFLLVSLLIYPSWPLHWLGQVGGYDGFVPLTYLPLLLLTLLLVWRRGLLSHRVGFYLLFCLSPQRIWHDQVLLWYVPTRAWQIMLLTALSWASPLTMRLLDANWVLVACVFVPCGLFLLLDRPGDGGCVAGRP